MADASSSPVNKAYAELHHHLAVVNQLTHHAHIETTHHVATTSTCLVLTTMFCRCHLYASPCATRVAAAHGGKTCPPMHATEPLLPEASDLSAQLLPERDSMLLCAMCKIYTVAHSAAKLYPARFLYGLPGCVQGMTRVPDHAVHTRLHPPRGRNEQLFPSLSHLRS